MLNALNRKSFEFLIVSVVFAYALWLCIPPKTVYVPVTTVIEKQVPVNVIKYLNAFDKEQINCLTENAIYEAGNQPTIGKIAVGQVVMNRVKSGLYPNTACKVIKQKDSGKCQFSWVCNKPHSKSTKAIAETKQLMEKVYLNTFKDYTYGSIFYHASYVLPSWAKEHNRTVQIGDHVFYSL